MGALFGILGLISGMGGALQTSVNTELRLKIGGSPLAATFLSFFVGTLTLLIMVTGALLLGLEPELTFRGLHGEPLWIWAGGALGAVFVMVNILLFPRIGSVQTIICGVLGQITTGLIVDAFGLFAIGHTVPLGPARLAGAALAVSGVLLVNLSPEKRGASAKDAHTDGNIPGGEGKAEFLNENNHYWGWRLLGISAGAAIGCQGAINSHLGAVVGSRVTAALISFTVGTLVLILAVLITRPKAAWRPAPGEKRPPWLYTGGLLGVLMVLANIILVPILGASLTIVLNIIGQILGGILVDSIGLFGAARRQPGAMRLLGLAILIAGAILIHL